MAISFHNADISFVLKEKGKLKTFIDSYFRQMAGKSITASYVFCSDEYLLKINRDFLRHDYYTDIITFPLIQTTQKVQAEIYISLDRVLDNAAKHRVSDTDELHRVMFHGVLHLAGYPDKTKEQKVLMRKAEEDMMEEYKRRNEKE
jgi:rRNA maturation RNase YbeY